jgi:pimeloyl-ACP methyl ester carboxylesterase
MDRLGIRRAALIGMSQGARVALRAATEQPRRVACLVLDGPPDEVAPAGADIPLDDYRELAERAGLAAVRRLWSRHPFMQLATSDPPTREHLHRILERYPGRDLVAPAAPIAPLAARLGAITVGAVVINGARDVESRRASGDRLCRAIPGARHALIPDAGHLPNLDNPSFYNAVLRCFLKETLDARA